MASIPAQTTATAIQDVLNGNASLYGASLNSANFLKEVNSADPSQV